MSDAASARTPRSGPLGPRTIGTFSIKRISPLPTSSASQISGPSSLSAATQPSASGTLSLPFAWVGLKLFTKVKSYKLNKLNFIKL